MEQFHCDGDGALIEPISGNSMVTEYNDKKGFTLIVILAVLTVSIFLATCFVYGVALITLNIIEHISK